MAGLVVGQGSTRANGTSGAIVREPIQAKGLVSRPPARDGFTSNTKHLGHLALREAHLKASQGSQSQFLQDFIGQLPGIGECDRHGSYSCFLRASLSLLCEHLPCQGNTRARSPNGFKAVDQKNDLDLFASPKLAGMLDRR